MNSEWLFLLIYEIALRKHYRFHHQYCIKVSVTKIELLWFPCNSQKTTTNNRAVVSGSVYIEGYIRKGSIFYNIQKHLDQFHTSTCIGTCLQNFNLYKWIKLSFSSFSMRLYKCGNGSLSLYWQIFPTFCIG